ncbi:MAG: cytochrome P450 [Anaerolineae bacterium]|nr:cytochrome P450 [Anaerolineae bacterium]
MTTTTSSLTPNVPATLPGPCGVRAAWRNLRAFRADLPGFLLHLAREYGDFVQFDFGPFRTYFINHPDLLHHVLVSDASRYYKTRITKAVLRPLLGEGLLISDGDLWKRQRRLLQPAFHAARIAAYAETMVQCTLEAMHTWQPGEQRRVDHDMMTLTLEIVIRTLFGEALSPEERDAVGHAVDVGQRHVGAMFKTLFRLPTWLPTPANRELKRAVQVIDQLIARFVARYRQSKHDRGDLLSMMLSAVDETGQMTDVQARDEAFTLIVAGHETTANTLSWAWYLLAKHPRVEARLHDELDRVLGRRAPTVDDLPRLPYTEAVVKETLRLYPAAYVTAREPIADVELGGHRIPKGRTILIAPYTVHRDPRWYEQPETFMPERWLGDLEKHLPRLAYLPFGAGPRVCIGNAFAMMEARLILATVAQRFRFVLAPGQRVEPEPMVTLRPRGGLCMRVVAR